MNGKKALIINADDFGLSPKVSQGIIQVWQQGVVSSTSALVTAEGALKHITHAPPDLPMGLHLNITTGKPLSNPADIPTLVNEKGEFYDMPAFLKQLSTVNVDDIRREINAQAKAMQQIRPFDHLDYHHHIFALYRPFFALLIEIAKEFNVPVRQPAVYGGIRLPARNRNYGVMLQYLREGLQSPYRVLQALPKMLPHHWQEHNRALQKQGVATTEQMISDIYGNAKLENFRSIIQQLPEGITEIVVHPAAEVDGALELLGGAYLQGRIDELALLCDSHAEASIREAGITMLDFSQMAQWRAKHESKNNVSENPAN